MPSSGSAPPQSCDGKPLGRIASKITKPKSTGDQAFDAKKMLEHDAFVRIVDKMEKCPSVIMPLHGFMQTFDLTTFGSLAQKSPGQWTGDYRTIDRIPKGWISEFLVKRSIQLGMSALVSDKTIAELEQRSPDAIPTLFNFETQTMGTMMFPPDCRQREIASLVFTKRAEEVGNRLLALSKNGGFSTPGVVDYKKACFQLHFNDQGVVERITHVTGADSGPLPAHVQVTQAFSLMDNHLDHCARLVLGPAKYMVADFFREDAPFKRLMVQRKCKRLHEIAATVLAEQTALADATELTEVKESDRTLKPALKKRSEENLTKAKAKLQERQEERKKARTLILDGAANLPVLANQG